MNISRKIEDTFPTVNIIGKMRDTLAINNVGMYRQDCAENFKEVLKEFAKSAIKVMNADNIDFVYSSYVCGGSDLRVQNPISGLRYYSMSSNNIRDIYKSEFGTEEVIGAGVIIDVDKKILEYVKPIDWPDFIKGGYNYMRFYILSMEELDIVVDKRGEITMFAGGDYLYTESDYIDCVLSSAGFSITENGESSFLISC